MCAGQAAGPALVPPIGCPTMSSALYADNAAPDEPTQSSGTRTPPLTPRSGFVEIPSSLPRAEGSRPRPDRTGVFHYLPGISTMVWSDAMYAIHGYERGDVVPTLATGFAHLEPAVQAQAHDLWEELLTSDAPVAWYYTLTNAQGRRRHVLAVAELIKGEAGDEEVRGYLVDITTSVRDDAHRDANLAVARSAESRALIEQAKGILMALQGISAEAAYLHLSHYSQHTNRKVSLLARDVVGLCGTPDALLPLTQAICSHSSHAATP